jgi:formylglycine-generating enzyme required for sulfatase activity
MSTFFAVRHSRVSHSKKIKEIFSVFGILGFTRRSSLVWIVSAMISCSHFLSVGKVKANNIAVSATTLTGQDTAANFTQVQFSISWQNSWRVAAAPANWDAAWVFVKFCVGEADPVLTGVNLTAGQTVITAARITNLRVGMPVSVTGGTGSFPAGTVITAVNPVNNQVTFSNPPSAPLAAAQLTFSRIWEHAELSNVLANHTAPTGSEIVVPADGKGVFIQRNAAGVGTASFSGVRLRWNYGANSLPDFAHVQVRVFAVEMVYIPQSAFFVGSGGIEAGSFTNGSWTAGNSIPLQMGSEDSIIVAQAAGNLWGTSIAGTSTIGPAGVLPAAFPKGFAPFYCMKYEVSQAQYRDFLNCLTRTQQESRILTDGVVGRYAGGKTWNGTVWTDELNNRATPGNRIGLRLSADPGGISPRTFGCDITTSATLPTGVNQTNDGEWIAMGQLNWMDCCAYLDWAGLRPMTELEFEKVCRGNQPPVANEYAWGNAVATAALAANFTNQNTSSETTTTANANAVFNNGTAGLMRVGNFAKTATNRVQSGAAYYGVMDMSGNAWEPTVTIGNTEGRKYTGLHGDGSLSRSGNANVTNWPGLNAGEVTGHFGSGVRGGDCFIAAVGFLRVSDRGFAVYQPQTLPSRASHLGCRGVRRMH